MCKAENLSSVLPFMSIENNCRSEQIERMPLSNMAVTTEHHQGKYMGLILAKCFILNVCHFSFY